MQNVKDVPPVASAAAESYAAASDSEAAAHDAQRHAAEAKATAREMQTWADSSERAALDANKSSVAAKWAADEVARRSEDAEYLYERAASVLHTAKEVAWESLSSTSIAKSAATQQKALYDASVQLKRASEDAAFTNLVWLTWHPVVAWYSQVTNTVQTIRSTRL